MKQIMCKFIMFSGIWVCVINMILLVFSDGFENGRWKGLDRDLFVVTVLCCIIEMFIILFGN